MRQLVELGEPFFNNDAINEAIKALPQALDLVVASVKIVNNTLTQDILGKLI